MSQTTSPVPGPAAGQHFPGPAGPPSAPPVAAPRMVRQRRRRPGLIALSVALIAVGGLSGAVLYTSSGHRTSVVVVARDVPIGAQITQTDLTEASIALDPAVKAVKASGEKTLIGQRAAVDLKAGSLLSPSEVTRQTLVGPTETLVGVSLKPSQLPASPLSAGQKVLIVSTPDPNAAAGSKSSSGADVPPATLSATVVKVGDPQTGTGTVTVDVAVPAGDGPALAARVATGNVALIVASRDGN
ncbi:SAF domain-containing protein [Actinacidiphila rubida]|uniref:SAF domain-containing protein n=1 Tax=Actinacidiphila rubida TaxID=310780 RepID=A0A1H8TFY3_9ACTN|nr:SAF domain-containing protein [Actinacidiphila rubida]SEO89403.1 SAF domain-containing protein [Actinacidiphila rubida]